MATCKLQIDNEQRALNVLQITDSHLFADEGGTLLGVRTAESFKAVLTAILRQDLPVDFILFTGDISQDYSVSSYQRFAHMIACLQKPVFFVPGNHDDGPLMYRIFPDFGLNIERSVICGKWHFVMLNSEVYGVPHGWVERDELSFLQSSLDEYPDYHTVVAVHHLPQLVGSRWLDTQTMHNQDEFNAFISRYPQVRLVLCGHVHQEFDVVQNNIRYIASPSTSIQFEPYSQDFALDMQGPGWRYLRLDPHGGIETQVYRLPKDRFMPDTVAGGY